MTLREKIEQEIHEQGPMPFSRYTELCLYDPELGYYARNANQFGKAGDFYTSSDVHAVFGRLLARQFEEMWRALGSPGQIGILELGPGRGLFARDVLDWSAKKFPEFFGAVRYTLAEASPSLRKKIGETLSQHFETGKASLSDPTAAVPERFHFENIPLIVFANEFFDALAVEIVSQRGSLRLDMQNGRLVEAWVPTSAEELDFLDRYSVRPELGERMEVPLIATRYLSRIAEMVPSGFFVAIDYGYTRAEQLAGRHRGTLMTYRQHSASPNPYEAPGEQDLTAHVNFTALAAAVEEKGVLIQPLLTQSQFLMGIGEANQFADAFEECRVPQERAKVALQLKHLVTPAGMGESFHVMVGSKGIEPEKAASLCGLSFGKSAIRG